MDYWGTRPDGDPHTNGKKWGKKEFLDAAFGVHRTSESPRVGLGHWRGGGSAPDDFNLTPLLDALFGTEQRYAAWREDMKQARKRSRDRRDNRYTLDLPEAPPPGTVTWGIAKEGAVPRPTANFMGRDDELHVLVTALLSRPLPSIIIQGGPALGKTELTKAVAHHPRVVESFENRRWFVPLDSVRSADAMRDHIFLALGCDPTRGFGAPGMPSGPKLLILDNLDMPWSVADEGMAVEQLMSELGAIPDMAIIATFRGRHAVGGLRWLEHQLAPLSDSLSNDLFASVAGSWALEDKKLGDFVKAAGGVPLAVELIARRAHGCTSLAPLWEQWKKIGTQLAVRPGYALGRLTSLSHSIELSLDACDENSPEHRLFSLLGAFPYGFAPQDVDAILRDDAFEAMERLRKLGLTIDRLGILELLPPIREYASRACPPREQDRLSAVRYFMEIDLGIDPFLTIPSGNSHALSNIAASCHVSIQRFAGLGDFGSEADCYFKLGAIAASFFLFGESQPHFEAAFSLYGTAGNRSRQIECLFAIGLQKERSKKYPSAMYYYRKALDLCEVVENKVHLAYCYEAIGKLNILMEFYECSTKDEKDRFSTIELAEAARIFRHEQMYSNEYHCLLSMYRVECQRDNYDLAAEIMVAIELADRNEKFTNPIYLW